MGESRPYMVQTVAMIGEDFRDSVTHVAGCSYGRLAVPNAGVDDRDHTHHPGGTDGCVISIHVAKYVLLDILYRYLLFYNTYYICLVYNNKWVNKGGRADSQDLAIHGAGSSDGQRRPQRLSQLHQA